MTPTAYELVEAVIPSSARRKPIIAYDRETHRQRNLIERMFARLKDFRRLATRYDKLARNWLTGVLLAATTIQWIELSPDPAGKGSKAIYNHIAFAPLSPFDPPGDGHTCSPVFIRSD
jgi:hypothetical protein